MPFHHLSTLVHRQAEKYGERTALQYRDYAVGQWMPISWRQLSDMSLQAADALLALGVRRQENVAIFSQNKPECFYVCFAAYAIHAAIVPLYATGSSAQVKYIVNDAGIRYLFVGEQYQYDAAFRVFGLCRTLQQLILFDRSIKKDPRDVASVYFDEFLHGGADHKLREQTLQLMAEPIVSDVADILYTSGTTGEPKGVILTHKNYLEAFRSNEDALPAVTESDVSLCFLPLTHVFERAWSYFCLEHGAQVCLNVDPHDVSTSLREVRPTALCSVPRLWEKIYQAVMERIERETGVRKAMMTDAIRVGRRYNLDYVRLGKTPPPGLTLKYKFYERSVFALLKRIAGLDRGRIFPVAGAFVSDRVCVFMRSVGIPFIVGYGLTETTATVSIFPTTGYVVGSVGEVLPDLDVKIGPNDEVLVRGLTVTPGYYRKSEDTADAFDADGWFHTGDAGRLEGRTLFLTERIKDLFKTSNGKYVSPQALESSFIIDRFIDQVAVIAEGRKFVSALIVPDFPALEGYASERGIACATREELLAHPKIQALFTARVCTLQQAFASYEQVKRFTLLPEPFSMERGELTNTLKLKRRVVAENYRDIIDCMYADKGQTAITPTS